MYNRYIPNGTGYTRVTVDERSAASRAAGEQQGPDSGEFPHRHSAPHRAEPRNRVPQINLFGGEDKNAGMAGILKALKLEELDSGDILLLLIMLFLFLEGDNIELVITLGLMLLLGLGEDKENDARQKE